MYRLIVVPLDGTASSEDALPWATSIATAAGCPVRLVRVADAVLRTASTPILMHHPPRE